MASVSDHVVHGNLSKETYNFLISESKENFIYLESGDYNVTYNFFNHTKLTQSEKSQNCFEVNLEEVEPFKGHYFPAGIELKRHERHLSDYFNLPISTIEHLEYDPKIVNFLRKKQKQIYPSEIIFGDDFMSPFVERILNSFASIEQAYHQLILDLVVSQIQAINLLSENQLIKTVFMSGYLTENPIFTQLLNEALFGKNLFLIENLKVIKKI